MKMRKLKTTTKQIKQDIENCQETYLTNLRKIELKTRLEQTEEICKMIEEDIELQKKYLKDEEKYFEENKSFMWRIHGFQSLLSRITGEEVKLLLDVKRSKRK